MIATGDVLEAAFYCRHSAAQNAVNRVYFQVTDGAGDVYDLDEVADQLSTQAGTAYRATIAGASKYLGCKVRRVFNNPTQVYTTEVGAGLGTRGGNELPPQLTLIVYAYPPFIYPKTRGRIYVPFPTDGDMDSDGSPNAGYTAVVTNLIDSLFDGPLTLSMVGDDVVLQYKIVKAGTPPELITPRKFVMRDRYATQRRRSMSQHADDFIS